MLRLYAVCFARARACRNNEIYRIHAEVLKIIASERIVIREERRKTNFRNLNGYLSD